MARHIRIGQYFDAPSPIHALDARVKLLCALASMIALFCIGTLGQLAAGAVFTVATLLLSRVPARSVLASICPVMALLAFLSLFNLVFVQTGDVLYRAGFIAITTGGVNTAILYTLRFLLAILVGSLILLTTTPTQLSDALDRMLAPLSRVGLPGHDIAMVLSLMLRFIPTLADETAAVLDAQAMRGGALDEGSMLKRLRSVPPVVVALLTSALRHADGLARALDARSYEGGSGRTHLHEPHLSRYDAVASAATVALIVALVALR